MNQLNLKQSVKHTEDGFTLIEVLVAVLVFSFGLLGIAGLMSISVKNNHNGYMRSQANFLAENMVDRMRANPTALWNDAYNGTATVGALDCTLAAPCTFAQLAAFDLAQWAESLSFILPNAVGTVACVTNGALPANVAQANAPSIWFPAPPYNGICTITITWTESNREGAADAQTITMVAQP